MTRAPTGHDGWSTVHLWAAVAVVLESPALLTSRVLQLDDISHQYLPWFTYAANHLIHGTVPLWNPHVFGGMPFHTNPEASLYCPLHVLFMLFPFGLALSLLSMAHVFLAGTFMDLFLGRLGLGSLARIQGALVLVLSGYFQWQTTQVPYLNTLCWFPAVLWAFEGVMEFPGARRVAVLSVAWSLQFLGGSPEVFLFSNLFLASFAVWRLREEARERTATQMVARMVALGVAVLLVVAATAVQWLPTLEFISWSNRVNQSAALGALQQDVPGTHVFMSFLTPWLMYSLGAPFPFEYLRDHVATVVGYVGSVAVALAWVGVLCGPRGGRALWLFSTSAVALMLSHAPNHPWLSELFTVVPFKWFRWPHNFLLVHLLCTCVLSARGVQAWMEAPRAVAPVLTGVLTFMAAVAAVDGGGVADALLVVGLCLVTCALVLARQVELPNRSRLACSLLFLTAVDLMVFSLDAAPRLPGKPLEQGDVQEMLGFLRQVPREHRVFFPDQSLMGMGQSRNRPLVSDNVKVAGLIMDRNVGLPALRNRWRSAGLEWATLGHVRGNPGMRHHDLMGFPVNYSLVAGFMELGGYDVFRLRFFDEYLAAVSTWRMLGEMDVKYVVSGGALTHPQLMPVHRADWWTAYAYTGRRVRSYLQCQARELETDAEVLAALGEADANPVGPVLVQGRLPEELRFALRGGGRPAGTSEMVEYSEDRVRFAVDVRRPCLLVLNDTWYPGWKARSEQGATPLIRVNHLFRAVLVLPYMKTVEMFFAPDGWRAGALVSGLAWLILAMMAWLGRTRGTGESQEAEGVGSAS